MSMVISLSGLSTCHLIALRPSHILARVGGCKYGLGGGFKGGFKGGEGGEVFL